MTKDYWKCYTINAHVWPSEVIRLEFMNNDKLKTWATLFLDRNTLYCPEYFLPLAVEWIVNNKYEVSRWYDEDEKVE